MTGEKMIEHKHIMVNATIAKPILEEQEAIAFLENLVAAIDMKIIKGPFASYVTAEGNRGMTATVMIETSHIAFHIWDEKQPAELKFDLYTCGALDIDKVIAIINEQFGVIDSLWVAFDRANGFKVIGQN